MNGNKMRVLIVEDNPGDAYMIEEMLHDLKMELSITVIEDGKQAVETLLRALTPDMVILDLNLPRMNGFDVLACMKAESSLSSVPVIVMTGSLRREDEIKARSMGAAEYCIKPPTTIEMEVTKMCLRNHLEIISRNKGNERDASPSTSVNLCHPLLNTSDHRILPLCTKRPMDVFQQRNLEPSEMNRVLVSWTTKV